MITYREYLNEGFNSEISEQEFKYISRLVKRQINYRTFNRFEYKNKEHIYYYNEILLSVIQDLIKARLNDFNNQPIDNTQTVKSETVGRHTIEYGANERKIISDDVRKEKIDKIIDRVIKEYLGHTGLMYRGHYRKRRGRR